MPCSGSGRSCLTKYKCHRLPEPGNRNESRIYLFLLHDSSKVQNVLTFCYKIKELFEDNLTYWAKCFAMEKKNHRDLRWFYSGHAYNIKGASIATARNAYVCSSSVCACRHRYSMWTIIMWWCIIRIMALDANTHISHMRHYTNWLACA